MRGEQARENGPDELISDQMMAIPRIGNQDRERPRSKGSAEAVIEVENGKRTTSRHALPRNASQVVRSPANANRHAFGRPPHRGDAPLAFPRCCARGSSRLLPRCEAPERYPC